MAFFLKGLTYLGSVLLIVTAVLFVDFAYKTFSMRPRDVEADAIVVLAGGKGRIEEGVRLFREGKGRYLFLVGVDPAVRKRELFRENPIARDGERVFLENVSRNTLENAVYGGEMIRKRADIRSIKLLTSRYHMKRATLIFRTLLPRDIAIYPHPVESMNLKEEWWSHGGSFRLLFTEFYKYTLFRFFFLFASGELRPLPGR